MSTEKAIVELSHSERFTNEVCRLLKANTKVEVSEAQRKLISSYFIKLDMTIKAAELKRLAKSDANRTLPITWANVNMEKLANDTMMHSKIGLNPMQPNHLHFAPFKNNSINKYDLVFTIGYRGCEIKAKRYGLNMPKNVIVELVYSTDYFEPLKKDAKNEVENYIFSIKKPFSRGDIVGGFYYHVHENPRQNRLRIFSMADIEKRIPKTASVEFWGGEKDEWVNGQKTGNKIKVEGWRDEMAWKTIYRSAFNDITIDGDKVDDAYVSTVDEEFTSYEEVKTEIPATANTVEININEEADVIDTETVIENNSPSSAEEVPF